MDGLITEPQRLMTSLEIEEFFESVGRWLRVGLAYSQEADV